MVEEAVSVVADWLQNAAAMVTRSAAWRPLPRRFASSRDRLARAPGRYFVRTEVTWEIGGYYPTQGGLVAQAIEIPDGQAREVILNHDPE